MSTVTLIIGPKSYTIACADGQEAHITALGAMIAEKYARLGPARAPLEAQNLLFSALFLADELADARKKKVAMSPDALSAADTDEVKDLHATIARLQAELIEARSAPAASPLAESDSAAIESDLFGGQDRADSLAQRLEVLASRAEASATALEAATASA